MKKKNFDRSSTRSLRGSLVFRVLLIETLFLVIPLLIFAVILYYEDSRLKDKEFLSTLTRLLKNKQTLIGQVIEDKKELLNAQIKKTEKLGAFSSNLGSSFPSLFHLTRNEGGEYICDRASDPELLKENFSGLMPENLDQTERLTLGSLNRFFYLFEPVSGGQEVWGIRFSSKHVIDRLSLEKEGENQLLIFVLSREGKVLLSTSSVWQEATVEFLEGERVPIFVSETERGKIGEIPYSSLLICVAVPKHPGFTASYYFLAKVGVLFLLILGLGGGLTYLLARRLSRPLRSLCLTMERIRSSDLSARYQMDSMGFEINIVGEIFNKTICSLIDSFERVEKERLEKEAFKRELMIGQEVQSSILPKTLPSFLGLDIASCFIPAKEVGGDFYDFLTCPNEQQERLFFSIADTAGKGFSACLYSLTLRSLLRSYAQMTHQLDLIISKSNQLFCLDAGDTGMFVTAWVGMFDQKKKELYFSNCGHFPAYLMRADGSLETLTTRGAAFGIEPFDPFEIRNVQLRSGDILLLFTDGIIEALNERVEMFGEKRLIKLLEDRKDLSAQQIVDGVIEELHSFTGGIAQYDDLTLLVFKVR